MPTPEASVCNMNGHSSLGLARTTYEVSCCLSCWKAASMDVHCSLSGASFFVASVNGIAVSKSRDESCNNLLNPKMHGHLSSSLVIQSSALL